MEKKPRIAVAQVEYHGTKEKYNVAKIKKYIGLAKKKNADIVCFPEAGIGINDVVHYEHEVVKDIRGECKKNSIWAIVTGYFKTGKKEYNTSLLINRNGEIAGTYKKINLYDEKLSRGARIRVFRTDFARIAIVICWDLAFPELFARLKEKRAEIVFCPSRWWYESFAYRENHVENEKNLLRSIVQARAFENLYFVALCNPVMEPKEQVSYSAIAGPHLILSEIFRKEGLILADLNLGEIKKFRKHYPNK